MEYATIWEARRGEGAGRYRIEYRATFDLSAQQEPQRVEFADTKKAAIHKVVLAGARLWN